MSWQLQGTYFENCNCDMVCPCTVSAGGLPAPVERCVVSFVFHVDQGNIDGLDVSNKTVIVLADTPSVMADGNWRIGVIVDAAATKEQAAKLTSVFTGKSGGPMAMLAPAFGEMLGLESVDIEYRNDGLRHAVKAGDLIDIEIEDFVPRNSPNGEPARLTGMVHVANSTLTIAKAVRARVNVFGHALNNDGRNGHAAPFSWAS